MSPATVVTLCLSNDSTRASGEAPEGAAKGSRIVPAKFSMGD
jgi:hypothetical protein